MGFLLKRKLDAMMVASVAALLAGDAANQAGLIQMVFNAVTLPEWGFQGSAAALGAVLVGRVIYFARRMINFVAKVVLVVALVVGAFYLAKFL